MSDQPKQNKAHRALYGVDATFLAACAAAGITPTQRQYAKWRQKRGKAYNARNG